MTCGLLGVLRFPTFISLFSFSLVQLGIAGAVFTSGKSINIPYAYADLRFNPASMCSPPCRPTRSPRDMPSAPRRSAARARASR